MTSDDFEMMNNIDLNTKAANYLSFMDDICSSLQEIPKDKITVLFGPDLKKIADGKILLENRLDLISQLMTALEKCGSTTIT